jgi:serine/threonine protein kinase
VYKSLDLRLDRFVALKVLSPDLAEDANFRQQFQREAQTLLQLLHPNITRIHDFGATDTLMYLAVEFVDGFSLAELIARQGILDVDYAIEIVQQVGDALDYAHQQGIVHRDIKPSNILISTDGRVLLSDLGLATLRSREPSLTDKRTVLGTPAYMSPEQAEGAALDQRSDIYSLGLVAYELIAGRLPFSGGSPLEFIHQALYEQPPSPRQFNPRVSVPIESVVLRALKKNPGQRYQSVRSFMAALDQAGSTSESAAPLRTRPQPHRSPSFPLSEPPALGQPRSRAIVVFAGIVILAILAGLLWWNWGQSHILLALSIAVGSIAVISIIVAITTERRRFTRSELWSEPPDYGTPDHHDSAGFETDETPVISESPIPRTVVLKRESSVMAWLLVLNGESRGRKLELGTTSIIGRDPACDIVLDDPSVSREHAKMRVMEGRFHIYDLATSNGTFVNEMMVYRHELHDRDELRIGNTIMLFIQVASPEDLTAEAKRRLREFDSAWEQITKAARND